MTARALRATTALTLVASLLAWDSLSRAAAQMAIIVRRDNPVRDLSLATLRRLYLGQTTTFSNGERVVLLEYTPLQATFYRKALGMSPELVHRHWIGLVFQGEDAMPPQPMNDDESVKRFVAEHPGAIGFIDLRTVDPTVKVLTVNGRAPGDANYPLR